MDYLNIYDNKTINEYESCFNFGFDLDYFQKEACYRISIGENVFVTAHTGCGRQLSLYMVLQMPLKKVKVIYTSPTKSLSNQKYKEFSEKFATVGILTGDIKVNPEADIIIMTTEILLNMLYKQSDNSQMSDNLDISEVGCVIFDEVHYINDLNRGKYGKILVLLPSHKYCMSFSNNCPAR